MAAFPQPSDFNEEESETLSHISAGSLRQETRGLRLDLDMDSFVIHQVVARGSRNLFAGRFAYELQGVVVSTDEDVTDLERLRAHFVFGVVPSSVLQEGITKYKALVQALDLALEPADRLVALQEVLESGRAFYGLDLGWLPADLPLLHFCAKQGYAECVGALLQVEGFRQSLGHRCKHRFTLLHLVAWHGHLRVLQSLGEPSVESLCDVGNEYGELPETSALIHAVELRHGHSEEAAVECEAVAIELRRLRTGQAVTLHTFVSEANENLLAASRLDKVLIPYCVAPDAIIQTFRGRDLRCTELVARHVDLAAALPDVLQALRGDFNLERLVLEGCGLTRLHAELLSTLVSRFRFTLASLELAGNSLGDEGVEELARTGAVGRVQYLSLGSVGMTMRGLASLAASVATGAVEKLLIGDNDFEAVDRAAMGQFETFMAAVGRSPKLVELDLGKTRLRAPHLRLLAGAIEVAPSLLTLKLNQVALNDEFASLEFRANPFLRALMQPRCNVTRLEVILVDYPDLFKTLKRAVRYRTDKGGAKAQGKGYRTDKGGAKAGGKGKDLGKGNSKGKGKEDGRWGQGQPVLEDEDVLLRFPTDLCGRVRLLPTAHPDFETNAELCCESFTVRVETDSVPEGADGRCYRANVGVRTHTCSARYALGNAPARQTTWLHCFPLIPAVETFTALAGLSLVLYRPSARSVMLVRHQSSGAPLLLRRLRDYALSTDYVLQDRFGQTGRKMLRRLDFAEVMGGINVADFSDAEVHLVAHADEFNNYLAWVGVPTATPRHFADHARYMRSDLFRQLLDTFRREESRRAAGPRRQWLALPSVQLESTRISGYDELRRISLKSTIEQCLLTYFAGSVGCPGLPGLRLQDAMELQDEDGRWKRLLFHITIPSEMEEGEGVKGLRPSAQPPVWVPVDQVVDHIDDPQLPQALPRVNRESLHHIDDPQLPQALQQLTRLQPVLTLAWRDGDAAALNVRARAANW